jgi:hypothetical protein
MQMADGCAPSPTPRSISSAADTPRLENRPDETVALIRPFLERTLGQPQALAG